MKKYFLGPSSSFLDENVFISNLLFTSSVDRMSITSDFGRIFSQKRYLGGTPCFAMNVANVDKIAKIRGKTEEIWDFFCPTLSEILIF